MKGLTKAQYAARALELAQELNDCRAAGLSLARSLEAAKAQTKDERSLVDLAREALNVQDACNLSGAVLGFGRAVVRLRAILEVEGTISTDKVNRHPVCVLWANKIESLTGERFSEAYRWATSLIEQDEDRKRVAAALADAALCLGCGGNVEMPGVDDLCPPCAEKTPRAAE